jgi:hypothetical protein
MLTPYQDRKMKNLTSIYTSDDFRSKKNRRKKKVNFQNKCVSSQNHRSKKRRGRHCRGVSPTFLTAGCFVRAGRAAFSMETFNFTGKPHKIPLMSYLRETPRFSDFQTDWPSKTDEPKQIKQRMQPSLRTDQKT